MLYLAAITWLHVHYPVCMFKRAKGDEFVNETQEKNLFSRIVGVASVLPMWPFLRDGKTNLIGRLNEKEPTL